MNKSVINEVSSSLLFRYRIPCAKIEGKKNSAIELPETAVIPNLGETEDGINPFAELKAAWNDHGLYFNLKVQGKQQSLWCKKTQLLESDGVQFWIDTRDTHNVHRATRYCHWLLCIPQGEGGDQSKPLATMLKINRAKEHSPTINQFPISIASKTSKTGYTLSFFIPGTTINGWDTTEHRMIGFNYLVSDRELGTQTLGVGPEFAIGEDPSLWHTLILQG